MSTITFRLDRQREGWRNRSELTFHLEDWNLTYPDGAELLIQRQRPRLLGVLEVTRPLSELAAVTCDVRRLGNHRRMSATYHWVAALRSQPESDFPRIEFFVVSQQSPPASDSGLPYRVKEFLRHLVKLTNCPARRVV